MNQWWASFKKACRCLMIILICTTRLAKYVLATSILEHLYSYSITCFTLLIFDNLINIFIEVMHFEVLCLIHIWVPILKTKIKRIDINTNIM